ncbi:hypothetical protein B0T16DRAFT_406085 [Cercophora newfieldiana]|uniref:F-box domain-containing protein n=1 Tax=Cercophora newfieldiana TaxID=92897 RepID=A0AA40CVQ2_9PEZI|nr:hypothetical protein B0T16DRAFT_406085 [Cercophora newfieldiana]
MPKPSPALIASQIEQLPLELLEPILENLSFRDVIALVKYAGEGSRLVAALTISPKWRGIWPTYEANAADFQTLVSLIMPVGPTRMFDPTCGALDLTPSQYYYRLQRERNIHGPNYDFFEYVTRQASLRILKLLRDADDTTLSFFTQMIPLDAIAVICPWLKTYVAAAQQRHPDAKAKAVQAVRDKFLDAMGGYCRCMGDNLIRTPGQSYWQWKTIERPGLKSCSVRHPDRATHVWTVSQMKAFVDAYSTIQRQLNEMKASQLQDLAKLYSRHHSRLKEPLAPQGPRSNIHHIPHQLEVVSRFVTRIIDIDRFSLSGKKQGFSRFRFVHPCLIPYDWCLQLWIRANEANPNLGGVMPAPFSPYASKSQKSLEDAMQQLSLSTAPEPPSKIKSQIQVVNEGMQSFYKKTKMYGKEGHTGPRTRIVRPGGDGTPEIPVFAVFRDVTLEVPKIRQIILPPINNREMKWLVAFLEVVEWMEEAHPDLAFELKLAARDDWWNHLKWNNSTT